MRARVFKCDTPGCKSTFEWPDEAKPGQARTEAVKAGWEITEDADVCGPCRFGNGLAMPKPEAGK